MLPLVTTRRILTFLDLVRRSNPFLCNPTPIELMTPSTLSRPTLTPSLVCPILMYKHNMITNIFLERDDKDAIDESNIIEERTRGATQPGGTYTEPGDEEGLPSDNGRSSNY
jgi:hypothetical protein